MKQQQLDLFAPRGEVVPFPVERQRNLIRDVVRLLGLRKPAKQRTRYWRATLGRMVMTLHGWRVDQRLIEREAAAFYEAVRAERNRKLIWGLRPDYYVADLGGGAA
jgi:hypothetical protein